MAIANKKLVEELRYQWKKLWQERVDDKLRAEGIATKDYSSLFVEKGTIIKATKDYKALNFSEIVENYKIVDLNRYICPLPGVGGWNKFIKTKVLPMKNSRNRKYCLPVNGKKEKQQTKKGGRGWLHQ